MIANHPTPSTRESETAAAQEHSSPQSAQERGQMMYENTTSEAHSAHGQSPHCAGTSVAGYHKYLAR